VNELVNLSYGDVEEEYEKGVVPICLKLIRQKTGVPFKTFFGCDALKYLRLYLQTRKNLISESPLFTKWGSEERITTAAIQQKFSEIAKDLPFIKKKDLVGFNPARPHSLRAAFKSKLTNKISDDLIEFWMGHTLGGVKDAYLNMPTEELRELYMDAEKYLAIEETSREELTKLEKGRLEISAEIEHKVKGLETTVSVLQQKVGEQKTTIETMYDKFEARTKALANEMFERWKKEARDLIREEQEAIRDEEKEREEIQRKLPPIPKEEIISLHKKIEERKKKEPPTSQKMIKISGEKKEDVPLIKTEETVVEPSIETIPEKTPEIKEVETNDLIGKICPECGSHSLKNGSCFECGYRSD